MSLRLHPLAVLCIVILISLISSSAFSHGMSEEEKMTILQGGFLSFFQLGVTHMLSGYDHLAFVFGIVFFLRSFAQIAKYITVFTLGHSLTLIWATYEAVQINYFLIDAMIALSVCYIAFANLDGFQRIARIKAPNMLMMVAVFGLIHGFGLSTRLQELPLDTDNLLLNIIVFNLGIEVGQIGVLIAMLGVLKAWRSGASFPAFSRLANGGLIVFGLLLFLMQLHDYSHFNSAQSPAQGQSSAAANSDGSWLNNVVITVPAHSDKEYKLLQAKGQTLTYEWQTTMGQLYFDFHGEPAGDKTGFFQSYAIGTDSMAKGSVKTPFTGTHGWYWKNNSKNDIQLSLRFRGEYLLTQ